MSSAGSVLDLSLAQLAFYRCDWEQVGHSNDASAELAQLYLELKSGNSRPTSFRAFGGRGKDPEFRKLANLLLDSDRFGTSLAPALRSHAHHLRTRFRQHAQETARKVGVKLIFPVFFLIFPSVLLVTLGPACMMMFQQLKVLMD